MKTTMKRKKLLSVLLAILLVLTTIMPEMAVAASKEKSKGNINQKKVTILVSKTVQLRVNGISGKVKWSSSNKKVASVTKNGKVTGKKAGKAKITAKVGKKKFTCSVKVNIGLDKTKITLQVGKKTKVHLCGTKVKKVVSTNKAVATVSKNGDIKGIKAGTATIKFTGKNKKTYSCSVKVIVPEKKSVQPAPAPAPAPAPTPTYTVSFNSTGGTSVAPQSVIHGGVCSMPADPTRDGYIFRYWYSDDEDEKFDFNTPITSNITLYAYWSYIEPDNLEDDQVDRGDLEHLMNNGTIDVSFAKNGDVEFIEGPFTDQKVLSAADAMTLMRENVAFLPEYDEVDINTTENTNNGETHYRISSAINGIPVIGSEVILSVDGNGTVSSLSSSYQKSIVNAETYPEVSENEAIEEALDYVMESSPISDYIEESHAKNPSISEAEIYDSIRSALSTKSNLVIYAADHTENPKLVYQVMVNGPYFEADGITLSGASAEDDTSEDFSDGLFLDSSQAEYEESANENDDGAFSLEPDSIDGDEGVSINDDEEMIVTGDDSYSEVVPEEAEKTSSEDTLFDETEFEASSLDTDEEEQENTEIQTISKDIFADESETLFESDAIQSIEDVSSEVPESIAESEVIDAIIVSEDTLEEDALTPFGLTDSETEAETEAETGVDTEPRLLQAASVEEEELVCIPFISYRVYVSAEWEDAGEIYIVDNLLDSWSDTSVYPSVISNISESYSINVQKNGTEYQMVDSSRDITIYKAGHKKFLWIDLNEVKLPGDIAKADISKEQMNEKAVRLMINAEKVYDYYKNVIGISSFDRKSKKIKISYDVDDGDTNAYWNPNIQQFEFTLNGKFYKGLDVMGHEFTHAVISYIVGKDDWSTSLDSGAEAEALNESYADIMGSIIEGKSNAGKWTLGEDTHKIIRSLKNPTNYPTNSSWKFPDHYKNFDPNEDEHYNCNIFNYAAYLMMTDSRTASISDSMWAKVFYNSLYKLPCDATFLQARRSVIHAANKLGFTSNEQEAIRKAFDDVGISEPDSVRIVLRWGAVPEDLDSHLVGPSTDGYDRFHTWFSNKEYWEDDELIADLDYDDTTSYGPEVTTIHDLYPGDYFFYVHDYTTGSNPSSREMAFSGATVSVYHGTRKSPIATYSISQTSSGTIWNVCKISISLSSVNVSAINTYGDEQTYY